VLLGGFGHTPEDVVCLVHAALRPLLLVLSQSLQVATAGHLRFLGVPRLALLGLGLDGGLGWNVPL